MTLNVFSNDVWTSKQVLTNLLAGENIILKYSYKATTATFEPIGRVLTLPYWTDISEFLADTMLGHETGHALWTPQTFGDDIQKLIKKIHGVRYVNPGVVEGYVQILEDVRINRRIKLKFPGIRKDFYNALPELLDRGFFTIQRGDDATPKTHTLIDRICLKDKTIPGDINLKFKEDEQVWIDKAWLTTTWEDVLDLAEEMILFFAEEEKKQDQQQQQQSQEGDESESSSFGEEQEQSDGQQDSETTESGDSDKDSSVHSDSQDGQEEEGSEGQEGSKSDTGGTDPSEHNMGSSDSDNGTESSGTDQKETEGQDGVEEPSQLDGDVTKEFDKYTDKVSDMNSNQASKFHYSEEPRIWKLPKVNMKKGAVDFPKVIDTDSHASTTDYDKWLSSEMPIIKTMISEFMIKKAAKSHEKSRIEKKGDLNLNRLHQFRVADEIFLRNRVVQKGKNHGFIMFVDWSSSMSSIIHSVMKQTLSLAHFCRKLNLPFEVVCFTDWGGSGDRFYVGTDTCLFSHYNYNMEVYTLLSSRMTTAQFNSACAILFNNTKVNRSVGMGYKVDLRLHSTPLNSAIWYSQKLVSDFQSMNRNDITNLIFLTDGGATDQLRSPGIANLIGNHETVVNPYTNYSYVDVPQGEILLRSIKEIVNNTNLIHIDIQKGSSQSTDVVVLENFEGYDVEYKVPGHMFSDYTSKNPLDRVTELKERQVLVRNYVNVISKNAA